MNTTSVATPSSSKTFLVFATRRADETSGYYPFYDQLEYVDTSEWIVLAHDKLEAQNTVLSLLDKKYEQIPARFTTNGWCIQRTMDFSNFMTTNETHELHFNQILSCDL